MKVIKPILLYFMIPIFISSSCSNNKETIALIESNLEETVKVLRAENEFNYSKIVGHYRDNPTKTKAWYEKATDSRWKIHQFYERLDSINNNYLTGNKVEDYWKLIREFKPYFPEEDGIINEIESSAHALGNSNLPEESINFLIQNRLVVLEAKLYNHILRNITSSCCWGSIISSKKSKSSNNNSYGIDISMYSCSEDAEAFIEIKEFTKNGKPLNVIASISYPMIVGNITLDSLPKGDYSLKAEYVISKSRTLIPIEFEYDFVIEAQDSI